MTPRRATSQAPQILEAPSSQPTPAVLGPVSFRLWKWQPAVTGPLPKRGPSLWPSRRVAIHVRWLALLSASSSTGPSWWSRTVRLVTLPEKTPSKETNTSITRHGPCNRDLSHFENVEPVCPEPRCGNHHSAPTLLPTNGDRCAKHFNIGPPRAPWAVRSVESGGSIKDRSVKEGRGLGSREIAVLLCGVAALTLIE